MMPATKSRVIKNVFKDSMQLMQVTEAARGLPGVIDAAAVMATQTNKELLRRTGLLSEEIEEAKPDDLVVSVLAEDEEKANDALNRMISLIEKPMEEGKQKAYISLEEALNENQGLNLGIVSVPGEYAREVVVPMLQRGISVHLFSDHVSVEDEVYMKDYALERGLLLLGPSAGTSILGGKGIAFANSVRRGPVGIVSASGTGLQELSVILSRAGTGISQGFGVGGRDLSDQIMGKMTKSSISILEEDTETDVVCIVSKPPGERAMTELLSFLREKTRKRYVLCLLGWEGNIKEERIKIAPSLHAAAKFCIEMVGGEAELGDFEKLLAIAEEIRERAGKRRFLRGLFTGGTLAYEALIISSQALGDVYSNIPISPEFRLRDSNVSYMHTIVDMGEEEFTQGRAHPMIDPTLRNIRVKEELLDRDVAELMIDVMLGYASHHDPAGSVAKAVQEIRSSKDDLPPLLVHVCGTEEDKQNLKMQEKKLKEVGSFIFDTNAEMSVAASLSLLQNEESKIRLLKGYLGEE